LCHNAGAALCLFPFSEFFRRYALHAGEELGEGGLVGEMKVVSQLSDTAVCGLQTDGSFDCEGLRKEILQRLRNIYELHQVHSRREALQGSPVTRS